MLTGPFLRRPRSLWGRPRSPALVAVVAASALGLAVFTSVISATPASAHAELVKITPELNAQLGSAPQEVVLEFNEPVSSTFASVVVATATGAKVTLGRPVAVGDRVTQALSPLLTTGVYRVAFRVVSADGHLVTGESSFTLTLAPRTSPAMSAPSASSRATPSAAGLPVTPAQSTEADQGVVLSSPSMAIAGAIGLMGAGAGAGVLLWRRRRR